jgi:hypothetical protein
MIDVWKHGPLDPVDYLAEYIFKRSNGTWALQLQNDVNELKWEFW